MSETMTESPAEVFTVADVAVVPEESVPTPIPAPKPDDSKSTPDDSKPTPDSKPESDKSTTVASDNKKISLAAALALAHPKNVDGFLLHLGRCVRTRGGSDVVLLFATYSTRLAGAILALLSRTALRATAQQLVKMAFQLPPSASVDLATAPAPPLATLALALSNRIQAFCAMMGDWRTMNRMWGVLAMYFAARDLAVSRFADKTEATEEKTPTDRFESIVKHLDVGLLTTYHILEATAWLASKNVIPLSPKNRERAAVVSCRAWGVSVFMELGRALVERSRHAPTGDDAAYKEWKRQWNTSFLRNLCWAPLTINWGYTPFLSEMSIAALAAYPSFGYMGELWRATA